MSRVDPKPLGLFHNVRFYTMHLICHVGTLTAVSWTVQNRDDLYRICQEIYVRGPRGTDPKPYKIYEALGNDQYKLSRNNEVVQRDAEENLRTRSHRLNQIYRDQVLIQN